MSDAAPVTARSVPAIPLGQLYPPQGFWAGVGHVARAGWRPATGWVCVIILLVNGAVLPLARLKGVQIEPLDWHQLTPFVALLFGLGGARSIEKIMGASI